MRNLLKASSYFVMLVLLGTALMVVQPASMVTAEEANSVPAVKAVSIGFAAGAGGMGIMGSEVHQQAYLTYLVDEYAPETIGDWNAAFTERKKVAAELPEKGVFFKRISDQGEGGVKSYRVEVTSPGELEDGVPGVPAVKPGVVIKFGDGKEVKTFELKEGEAVDPGVEPGTGKDVLVYKAEALTPEQLEEMKANMELYQSFEQAVEVKDAAKLKALLPKILDDYKLINQKMSQMNEEIKKNQ